MSAAVPTSAQRAAEARAYLEKLVAFNTTSHLSNLELLSYIESLLDPLDIPHQRFMDETGKKANLMAHIGPDAPGGVILSGHTDVVPIDGQEWHTDPFSVVEKDGKLHGRGTSDMKSFIACCLALLPEMHAANLSTPIYYAFTYDEEIGCIGAPSIIQHLAQQVPKPSFALVGEPTEMKPVTAHKGVYSYETIITGHEAHSSLTHVGVNAVQIAARLIAFLENLNDYCLEHGQVDDRFAPNHTTVHVGVIEGGTARNIIPKHCRIVWEIRPMPHDDADDIYAKFEEYCATLRPKMKERYSGADIVTHNRARFKGMQLDDQPEVEQRVLHAANSNATHAVAFGTEAGLYQENGIPVVVCGPGSIAQAHQPNEFIAISELEKCVQFLRSLLGLTPEN